MKTKYIEGTNKKYSIREDGSIIRNYIKSKNQYGKCFSYKKSIIKPSGKYGYVCVTLNGKNTRFNPQKLLLTYFKYRNCAKCNNIFYSDNNKRRVCDSCKRESVRSHSEKWANKNRELKRSISNRYSKHMREVMTDNYVATRMGFIKSDLPKDVINLKRNQLKLHRELKKQKQNDTNKQTNTSNE